MESLLADLRFAYRSLAHRKTFTLVAIFTIALGIGPTATMYSVLSGILLNPLGYRHPDRLVTVSGHYGNGGDVALSVPEFLDLQRDAEPSVFTDISMTYPIEGNLTGADRPDRIGSAAVTGNFFNMLGVRPLLGRTFTTSEEAAGITPVLVISYDLWQRRFGGTPNVLGKHLRIDDDDYTIVGVMPRGFTHPGSTHAQPVDMWYVCGFRGPPFPAPQRQTRFSGAAFYARLAPGVTVQRAQAALARLSGGWIASYPADYPTHMRGFSVSLTPLIDQVVAAPIRQGLFGLMIAVSLVLLIASANVAGLQVMRGIARVGELTVRGALGASRGRIVRQLLTESVVVGAIGGILGVAFAVLTVQLVRSHLPATMPRASDVQVDFGVVAIGIAVTMLLTAVFGLLPALVSTRISLASSLRASAVAAVGRASRARTLLVVGEIALAVMLLSGAGLFMRSFWALQQVEPGFRTEHLLTLQLAIPSPNDPTRGKYLAQNVRVPYYTEIVRRVSALPNIAGVAVVGLVPLDGSKRQLPGAANLSMFSAEGAVVNDPADMPRALYQIAGPGLFALLHLPVLQGREFALTDDSAHAPVVIINQSLARAAWPGGDPLGKRLLLGPPGSQQPLTVVGVVADMRSQSLDQPDGPTLFLPYTQAAPFRISLLVRTKGAPEAIQAPVTAEIQAIEPDQALFAVATMDDLMAVDVSQRQYAALVVAAFAVLALILSGVGVYGLIAFMVSQRTRELGLRMALGSTPAEALKLVFAHGFRLTLLGALLGTALAAIGVHWARSLVYGVGLLDPVAFIGAPLVLLLIAAVACWAPARRAAAIDPIVALRMD